MLTLYTLQVGMPDPYLQQFIKIQQDQHQAANKFAEHLRRLKECIFTFEKCIDLDDGNGSKCSIGQNQHATFKCMWQQKVIWQRGISLSIYLNCLDFTHNL